MSQPAPNSLFATGDDPRRQKGRVKGSRARLATKFFEDVYASWEEQGPSVLARAAFHDPMAFANMVARLMPQKIEHSVPTDGLSDERLGEMLDFAERMAELKAGQAITIQASVLTDENRPLDLSPEEGGGGPVRVNGCQGEKTPHTLRAAEAETAETAKSTEEHNKLSTPTSPPAMPKGFSDTMPHGEQAPTRRPPVGKVVPKADHETIKARVRALTTLAEDPIDPESLF